MWPPPLAPANQSLRRNDQVWMVALGHLCTGGVVVSARGRIRVRWPDGVVGVFERRHARHLHLGAAPSW